jgi:hypothetical protein
MHTGIFWATYCRHKLFKKNVRKEWKKNSYFKLQRIIPLFSLVQTDADLLCVCPFQWDQVFFSVGRRNKIKYLNLKITYQSDHVLLPCLVKSTNVTRKPRASIFKLQHQEADTTARTWDLISTFHKTGNARINVTLRRVRVITAAVAKKYYIFWVRVCNISYPARKAYESYYTVIRITSQTIFGKKLLITKCVFWFSLQILFETFLVLKRTERDVITNVFTWSTRFSCQTLIKQSRKT